MALEKLIKEEANLLKDSEGKQKKKVKKNKDRDVTLEKKREYAKMRYEQLKSDPEEYQKLLERKKHIYVENKAKGKIKLVHQMSSRERKIRREKQRQWQRNSRLKKATGNCTKTNNFSNRTEILEEKPVVSTLRREKLNRNAEDNSDKLDEEKLIKLQEKYSALLRKYICLVSLVGDENNGVEMTPWESRIYHIENRSDIEEEEKQQLILREILKSLDES